MIHLCRFVESGIDILQAAQEDDHLISHTLPYAHDGDGRKSLIRTVDERLSVDPEVCKQSIQDAFRTVDLHPQSGDDRQRHNDRYEKCDFKIFLTVCRLIDRKGEQQGSAALQGHDDNHEFNRVQK